MKILIVRFSSIGDIVLTTPVIRCLKMQHPGVEIHYLTKKSFRGLLEHNPYITTIWDLQSDFKGLMNKLSFEQFDFIIDLHNNLRTKRVSLALHVPVKRVNKLNLRKWLLVKFKLNRLPDVHIVDRYLEVASKFNLTNDQKGLDFFIPSDTSKIPDLPQDYTCFAIGGQHQTKKLPLPKIIELCNSISGSTVIIGGKEDQAIGQSVKAQCSNVIDLSGKLTINQSALVMRGANSVVSHDTGMMHIAAALKKKVISIWGNTVPQFGMYPYLPGANSVSFEVQNLSCRPCSKIGYEACPKQHFNCMNQQNIDEIASAIND